MNFELYTLACVFKREIERGIHSNKKGAGLPATAPRAANRVALEIDGAVLSVSATATTTSLNTH